MNAEFQYFVDHGANIILAIGSVMTAYYTGRIRLEQIRNTKTVNRTEEIAQGLRHDIQNGMGTAIAVAAVEKIRPVLDEHRAAVVKDVTDTAEVVAAKLADATTKWDGIERRSEAPGRRHTDDR